MNITIAGYDDTCKSLVAVAFYRQMTAFREYREKYANITLKDIQGVEYLTTQQVKDHMKRLIRDEVKDAIYLIDEADIIFPADEYTDKEQKECMTFSSMTHKLETDVIMVMHRGKGINLKQRLATHRLVICGRTRAGTYLIACYDIHRRGIEDPQIFEVAHPEMIFDKYNRWELVKP